MGALATAVLNALISSATCGGCASSFTSVAWCACASLRSSGGTPVEAARVPDDATPVGIALIMLPTMSLVHTLLDDSSLSYQPTERLTLVGIPESG